MELCSLYNNFTQTELTINYTDYILWEKENIITDQASLSNYINNAVAIATQKITSYCLTTSKNDISFRPEAISPQELIKISNITEQYPELTFDSILIMNSKLPDYNLYIKARNLYIKNLNYRKIYILC